MQIPYLLVRGRKLHRVMGGNIGSRKEICENSGLPIFMVPRFNQSNGYMKRKLRAWRVQKCVSLVGAATVHTRAGPQTTPCHAEKYRVQKGNMRTFGRTNPNRTAFEPKQRLYEKEGTGKDTVLACAGPQTTPCHGG